MTNYDITPRQVASRLGRTKEIINSKGPQITVETCPFCHGGQHHDKWTFAIHAEKGIYNCMRGTCGASGSFRQLLQHLGLSANYELRPEKPPRRQYKKPETKPEPPDSPQMAQVVKYFSARKISRETLEKYKVGADAKGNVVMPYYENGNLVMVKFRPSHKPKEGERKGWREKDGKPVFWGMDLCVPDLPLVICEGEVDLLSMVEADIPNVVSLPSGTEDLTCVELCWDWLQQFTRYYIWTDSDEPGIKCRDKLIKRLGAGKCMIVHCKRKDANEVLYYDGIEAVRNCIKQAQPVPMAGLTSLASLPEYDPGSDVLITSGIKRLDEALGGGFRAGEVTVWTGVNSSGKSTLLGQVMLAAVNERHKVMAYSGELPARLFRYWIDRQAAGPAYLERVSRADGKGESVRIKPDALKLIREWYQDYFYLYDTNGASAEKTLFEVMEYAVQRYNVRVIMLDNLMTILSQSNDYYQRQSEFVGRCLNFAKLYDVHIHVVAHPRKVERGQRIEKSDVMGSGDITNRADNVLGVHRMSGKEKLETNADNMLMVFKNRYNGVQDIEINLKFDDFAKRMNMTNMNLDWDYDWVKLLGKTPVEQMQILDGWDAIGTEIDV